MTPTPTKYEISQQQWIGILYDIRDVLEQARRNEPVYDVEEMEVWNIWNRDIWNMKDKPDKEVEDFILEKYYIIV